MLAQIFKSSILVGHLIISTLILMIDILNHIMTLLIMNRENAATLCNGQLSNDQLFLYLTNVLSNPY